ncbi:hypothetical protein MAR_036338 [Mya arenaria]|uniref:Uncharacterized protein n=1 Tax=Mya arenaria TaxID=6604 RepID=A0ABY7EQM4_MYAAR|nr:hypothetical protein MAR_036338 [Mya arenaria]
MKQKVITQGMSVRFGLGLHSTDVVFNTLIDIMYVKLCKLTIWPHRDTIIKDMPSEYKKEFPTSSIIIDETEVKKQSTSALGQMYSDQ